MLPRICGPLTPAFLSFALATCQFLIELAFVVEGNHFDMSPLFAIGVVPVVPQGETPDRVVV